MRNKNLDIKFSGLTLIKYAQAILSDVLVASRILIG